MTTRRSFAVHLGLAGAGLCVSGWGRAQANFPTRPVTLVVPYTPSSGSDIISRIVAPKLSARWGQPVIVDNRPGASGTLGANTVAKAAPDGHSLLMVINTYTMAPAMYKALPFDPANDLVPVALLAEAGFALAVNPTVPAHDVASLLAHLKKNPGKLNYGTPGKGTPQHLAMELLKSHSGLDVVHVPYKGISGALTDLMGNQVQVMFASVHSLLPHARSGRLRLLAVTGTTRNALAPEVASFREQGIDYLDGIDAWFGVMVARQTPPDLVQRLNQDFIAVVTAPDVLADLAKQGLSVRTGSPEQFGALLKSDMARWAKLVKEAGITAD